MTADIPDRGPGARAVAELVTGLSTVAVVLRLITPGFILRRLGSDDFCLVLGWFIAIGLSASGIAGTTNGLGRYDSNISSEWEYWLSRSTYISTVLYNPALMATKTSILLLYRRLTKTTAFFHVSTTACLVLVNLAGLVFTLMSIFQCKPITETFNFASDRKKPIDIVNLYLVSAPVNILTDLVILLLPMPLFTGLVLPPKQKMILIATFALGGFVTVIDVMRIAYLQETSTTRLESISNSTGHHSACDGPEPGGKPCAMAFRISSWQKDSEPFHHEVLENSIRDRTDTLKDRDRLLSLLLSFLKIVVNSMLA